jgi:hypothetical protein
MSTIQENAAGSPVNCEQNARGTSFRNVLIAPLLQPGTENSEARCARLLSIFRCNVEDCRCGRVEFRAQDHSKASLEKSLEVAKRLHVTLKA